MKMFRSEQRKDPRRDLTEEELEQLQARRRVSPGKVSATLHMVHLPRDAAMPQPEALTPSTTTPFERRRWAGEAWDESALFGMTRSDDIDAPMLGRGAHAMQQLAWRPEAESMRPAAPGGAASAPIQGKGIDERPARESELALESSGSGEPLPEEVRARMEAALGMDFSAVRIHVGRQAASVGALAFTKGTDIFFAPGQYQPWSRPGQELLGHELAHVVQQARGRVGMTGEISGMGINQDPALEREADALGARAARGEVTDQPIASAPRATSTPPRPRPRRLSVHQAAADTFVVRRGAREAPSGHPAQFVFLDRGVKFEGDMWTYLTPENAVTVLCFANRHTIKGLAQNKGGMKANNTVLLQPVEMTTVAEDAYQTAWNDQDNALSVPDGTTFESAGITWDIVCRPSDNSIHINPKASGDIAVNLGFEIIGIRAYLSKRAKGDDHDAAKDFVNTRLADKVGDLGLCNRCIDALVDMGEV